MQIITADLSDFDNPTFIAPIERWFSLKLENGGRSLEDYLAQPDPLEEYRMIAALRHDPLSVHYQSAGAAMESLYGSPLAGKNLDELYNAWFRKHAYECYRKIIEEKAPLYERRSFSTLIKKIGYYKLLLPFGEDQVTKVISYIMPFDKTIKKHIDWAEAIKKTPWFREE